MTETMQFSLRIEPELVRTMDQEAEKEYKTRTEFIKEAIQKLLLEKKEKERMKQLAAELWLKGELSETQLKKALNEKEIKDLHFGKKWVDDIIYEIRQ